jgi:serine/threonine-protein kinase HipA
MTSDSGQEVGVLSLSLHGKIVGYLAGFQNGRNVLTFAEEFKNNPARPTYSLITHPKFPRADKIMAKPLLSNQKLHPTLSNLLPEGAMRELITQGLKTHIDNEFEIFSYLGRDLPGALIATPMAPQDIPDHLLVLYGKVRVKEHEGRSTRNKFSLAGVQMKFSMKENDGRYNLAKGDDLGDWIIKTPSTRYRHVPLNEYTAMKLASAVGIEIPEVKLVDLGKLENLPPINLPDEQFAFAIKRFDRNGNRRIHMEDFAQVLVKYPDRKYDSANYEQIGQVIYEYSGDGIADVQQFVRRLLVNILLANGDAHLKNWSLRYEDQRTPRLSPAYDILTTFVYMEDETDFALNLSKNKNWYASNFEHFERWSERVGVPWRAIKPHLVETLELARSHWPQYLKDLPMQENHKKKLRSHWKNLHQDLLI